MSRSREYAHLRAADHDRAHEPTGLQIGRYSHGGFFTCSADPEHFASFLTQ